MTARLFFKPSAVVVVEKAALAQMTVAEAEAGEVQARLELPEKVTMAARAETQTFKVPRTAFL